MMALMKCILSMSTIFMDLFSAFHILCSLNALYFLQNYALLPFIKSYLSLKSSFFGYIICPFWIGSRAVCYIWSLRKEYKKMEKNLKSLEECNNSIFTKLCGLQSPLKNLDSLIGLTSAQLHQRIVKQKDLKVIDLIDVYQLHVLNLIESKTGCVAQLIFEADVTAILADQALRNDLSLGNLHGLPIGLSNFFSVKGEDCTVSLPSRLGISCDDDAVIVKALKYVGAIPFVLTHVAPFPIKMTISSILYGNCKHPTHPDRAVGGACGGDAVLLKNNGAILCFGIDVIGDTRIPSAYCGTVAFKPTQQRLSNQGIIMPVNAPYFLPPTVSPMGTNVTDIGNVLKELCVPEIFKFDPTIPNVVFKPVTLNQKLTIGVYTSLSEIISSVPSIERNMHLVTAKLTSLGHTVVPIKIPNPNEILYLFVNSLAWNTEYSKYSTKTTAWNPFWGNGIYSLPTIPTNLRFIFSHYIKWQQGASCDKMQLLFEAWNKPLSFDEIERRIRKFKNDVYEMISENNLDVIIGPTTPSPALLNTSNSGLALMHIGYTILFNILNFPTGVVPFGSVEKEDADLAMNLAQKETSKSLFRQMLNQQKTAEGLPLSVQIASQPWNDELAIKVMLELANETINMS